MEYDSAMQRKKVLTGAITWMYLENILLREARQTKPTDCMIPFTLSIQNRQIHREQEELLIIGKRNEEVKLKSQC